MYISSSPVITPPEETISEPPTPTTGHISLLNDILPPSDGQVTGRPLLNMVPVLQQRSLPKSAYSMSQFSITSSALSVKSIGSSIIDTDFENDVYMSSVPAAIAGEDDQLSVGKDSDVMEDNKDGTIMDFLSEFREMTMSNLNDVKESQKRDMERLTTMLQNESNRRHAVEGRLHAQMLLQAETMVAMEIKLLRLEAKVEKQNDGQKRRSMGMGVANAGSLGSSPAPGLNPNQIQGLFQYMNVEGRTGSIVANETIDEEEDFGMRDIKEIQVRTTNDSSNGHAHGHNASDRLGYMNSRSNTSRDRIHLNHPNPTNIVMSSGVSLASGVTATSFFEDAHGVENQHVVENGMHPGDEEDNSARSNDGDVEDEGDGGDIIEDDGSASSEYICSCLACFTFFTAYSN